MNSEIVNLDLRRDVLNEARFRERQIRGALRDFLVEIRRYSSDPRLQPLIHQIEATVPFFESPAR